MLKFFQKMKKRHEENENMLNAYSFSHSNLKSDMIVYSTCDRLISVLRISSRRNMDGRKGRGAMKTI